MMSHDALIDALSGSTETTVDGAIVYRNAEGRPHRLTGPAVLHHTGARAWCVNGELHRTDGPAIERPDGTRVWYLNNDVLTEEEFISRISSGDFYEP